jgi:hypothetical protein
MRAEKRDFIEIGVKTPFADAVIDWVSISLQRSESRAIVKVTFDTGFQTKMPILERQKFNQKHPL